MFVLADLPRPITRYIIGLWHRRWLIIALGWLLAVAGWVALSFVPDRYTSYAQIYLNTDTTLNTVIEEEGARADFEKRVRVMRQQLLSRQNLEAVILNTNLANEVENSVDTERMVDGLAEAISVVSDEGQYFNIKYTDANAETAQQVVAYVVNLFIEQDIGAAISDSEQAVSVLETQINLFEQRLADKDREIAEFRKANAAELGGNERTSRRLDQREAELARIEDSVANAVRRRDSVLRQLSVTPQFTSGNELDSLKVQLAQLQSQFNDNYPDILALKAKIAELEANDSSLPTNPAYQRLETERLGLDDEIAVQRQRAVRVRQEIDNLTLTASQVPAVQAELQDIMRNYAQTEATYKGLLEQRDKVSITASLSEGGGTIDYTIYEEPKIAAEPSSPFRGLITLGISVFAFGVSAGLAFLLAQLDRSYTQAADLEEAIGLPVLGSISPAPSPAANSKRHAERLAMGAALVAFVVATGGLYWFQEIRSADPKQDDAGSLTATIETGGRS